MKPTIELAFGFVAGWLLLGRLWRKLKVKSFEEYRDEPKNYARHCWLRLRRHTYEDHLSLHGTYVLPVCTQCGWPGSMKIVPFDGPPDRPNREDDR